MSTTDRALYTIGVVVEGIGSDPSKSGGLAFCCGEPPTSSDYQWFESLINPPPSIEDEVDPFTGKIRTSGFNFRFANLDEIAVNLGYTAANESYELFSDLTDVATSIELVGSAPGLGSSIIWIDDEAILLSNYNFDNGTKTIYSCVRGYFSTSAATHESGAWVYTKNPYIKQRRVQVIRYDRETNTEVVKWTGYVTGPPTTDRKGVIQQLNADSTLAALQRATINRNAPKLSVNGVLAILRPGTVEASSDATESTVQKPDQFLTAPLWLQIDDTICQAFVSNLGTISVNSQPFTAWGAPLLEGIGEDEYRRQWDGYELLVVDGANKAASSTHSLGTAGRWFRHPLAIAMAGFLSTGGSDVVAPFDCLNIQWSAGANPLWFDLAGILQVIRKNTVTIDHLVLGWDGEPLNWFEFSTQVLLRPFGFYWSLTEEGLITISRMRSLGIDDFVNSDSVEILPDHLENKGFLASYNYVTALVGELPWREADRVAVIARDGRRSDSLRRSAFDDIDDLEFDLRTQRSVANNGEVQARLLSTVIRGYYGIPVIGVTVLDSDLTGASYDLGGFLSPLASDLVTPWFVDNTGTRVLLDVKLEQATGQIIGRRFDFKTGTYDLTLLLTSYRSGVAVDWRAPSGKIVSQASEVVTLVANQFHVDEADASYFEVGDTVDIWWAEGTYAGDSTARLVTAVSGNNLTISSDFVSLSAGQILRLANYDEYLSVHGNPIDGYTGVAYAFIADDSTRTIGAAGDAGDVYG